MSAPIKVAIRADAGRTIGTGHFARASAVASVLARGGMTELVLLANASAADLIPAYFPSGVRVVGLPEDGASPAAAMRELNRHGFAPEVIYLDHYGEVAEWEAEARGADAKLVVLDDLDAARRAEIIVRPHGGMADAIGTTVLRGPAYLPLSQSVTELAGRARTAPGVPVRLNICFGGSDATDETGKAIAAVSSLSGLAVDLVIGPGAEVDADALAAAASMPNVTVHQSPSQERLAELMSEADLALGAGGVMLWERLCLGVPSLVICVADNQRPQIETMTAAGAIRLIGDSGAVGPERIAQAVAELGADDRARMAMSEAGRRLVDGRGAVRLAGWIKALALDVRDVLAEDAADLFDWRTDERNWQYNWGTAGQPDFESHVAWLTRKLGDPRCVFSIIARGDEPVGVVRFDLGDEGRSAYLSIYLVPAWHGRQMGLAVYCAAERALRRSNLEVRTIVSRIHSDNAASERLHRDAGFAISRSADRDEWLDAVKPID